MVCFKFYQIFQFKVSILICFLLQVRDLLKLSVALTTWRQRSWNGTTDLKLTCGVQEWSFTFFFVECHRFGQVISITWAGEYSKLVFVSSSCFILVATAIYLWFRTSAFFWNLPFFYSYSESEQGIAQAIIRSVIDFKREPWPKVSDNAKDLVRRMLDPDPTKRLTAQEVLGTVHILSRGLKVLFGAFIQ